MIILTGAEKGGVGKSTLACNLAGLLALERRDVLLIDTDESRDSSSWFALRAEQPELPTVHCVCCSDKIQIAARDAAKRYQDVVIDAGGRDSNLLRLAMTVADVMIMPTLASHFDLWSAKKAALLIDQARTYNEGLRAIALINRASTNWASSEARDAAALIAEHPQLELAPRTLCERKAFRDCIGLGRTVFEIAGTGAQKAADEFWMLGALIGAVSAPDVHTSGPQPAPDGGTVGANDQRLAVGG